MERVFHVRRADGTPVGEFTEEVFRGFVTRNELQRDDCYWTEGMGEQWAWVSGYRLPAEVKPPPVPVAQPKKPARPPKPMEQWDGWVVASMFIAAFAPAFFPLFFVVSIGIVIAAFVLAVIMIAKGRPLFGALVIVACPLTMAFAFAAVSFGLEPGTLREKAERNGARERREQQTEQTGRR